MRKPSCGISEMGQDRLQYLVVAVSPIFIATVRLFCFSLCFCENAWAWDQS